MPLLQLVIAEHFDGQVWRMEIDPINHILFAEIRMIADRNVNFAAINLNNGETYFKNYTVDERWLTGIEAAFDGVLLLHFYQTENGPTHKGLAAIEASTGNLLWSNFNLSFDHLSINGPVLFDSRLHPPKYNLADIKNGTQIRTYQPSIDTELVQPLLLPQIITIPNNLPPLPAEPYGNNVHYLEYNNLRIVSLHALRAGTLVQYLYIISGNKLIFEDILNTNIQKLQPEAFVMYQNKLVYIKDRSEIKVLNL
ncbi:DUF4905 domain-containing protein [Mucilaginibacter robiniae]|uniref:DUF4905 domain-containing protein n=1 Tax=Mucilaginibacter robiniae TaxID=2728022 RepID=A0A7L5EA32_9SPHI|nr:DUF4905 domain-containing protein [Mucilaginibacter robiniae]QJD97763.1 DUF4905 domain-containing protein [Mucilaginibacter robiniae]